MVFTVADDGGSLKGSEKGGSRVENGYIVVERMMVTTTKGERV